VLLFRNLMSLKTYSVFLAQLLSPVCDIYVMPIARVHNISIEGECRMLDIDCTNALLVVSIIVYCRI